MRLRSIVGKPIVSGDTGEKLGHVDDLLIDDSSNELLGVVVGSGGWRHKEAVLPARDVQTFGGDAVIARSGAGLIDAPTWREQNRKE